MKFSKEGDFQRWCCHYLNIVNLDYFHVPNGIFSNPRSITIMKRSGLKPGIPDLLVLNSNDTYNGLAIELKIKSNKPSLHQKYWLEKFLSHGWASVWLNNSEDFEILVSSYKKNLFAQKGFHFNHTKEGYIDGI